MKTVIIGGGPSGVASAIYASKNNEEVIILERNNKLLKKLLITGNGRCNYFNEDFSIDKYYSENIDILNKVINDKNKKLFLEFFDSIGIVPNIKNGYYYPFSLKANSVYEVLLSEINNSNIKVMTSCYVNKITKENNKFIISYNDDKLTCDRVIISTGSKAYPKTGSDGNGYNLVKFLGHSINKVYPSLTKIHGDFTYLKKAEGTRAEVIISLYEDNKFIKQEYGEIQITKDSISGICVFNLSNIISKGLIYNKKEEITINFMPFLKESPISWINKQSKKIPNRSIFSLLEGFLNYKLIEVILSINKINKDKKWNELNSYEKDSLINSLTKFKFKISNVSLYDYSQVCGGGISLKEIDINTMESKIVKGLYLTGEILDVSGDCGGYNLGFAFISGILAGKRGNYD